jgi:myo-inositol-1(or 4)-monophosphatase
MNETMVGAVRAAGELVRERFGRVGEIRRKENLSSIVTEVDVAAEELVVEQIRRRFPGHNILAEESGYEDRGSDHTWVIDPLDGTSNYAAGLPWFGVMIAVFVRGRPVRGVMYLPLEDVLYHAEEGGGATRNGARVRVTEEKVLGNVLFAYAVDACLDAARTRYQVEVFGRLLNKVRNVRATNSLVDFAGVIDGRLGGFINHSTRLWDIAAPGLILREAGGRFTDLRGKEPEFSFGADACEKVYAVAGGSPVLHAQVLEVLGS